MVNTCKQCGSDLVYQNSIEKQVTLDGELFNINTTVTQCKHCSSDVEEPILNTSSVIKKGAYSSYKVEPKLVKKFRRRNRLTIKELSLATGYTKEQLKSMEKGKAVMPLGFRMQISELMSIRK